jgi:hypothetical protein
VKNECSTSCLAGFGVERERVEGGLGEWSEGKQEEEGAARISIEFLLRPEHYLR